jgi:hypothetical protein
MSNEANEFELYAVFTNYQNQEATPLVFSHTLLRQRLQFS